MAAWAFLPRGFAWTILLTPVCLAPACRDSSGLFGLTPEPHAAILVIQGAPYRLLRADASGQDTVTLLAESHQIYSGLYPAPDGTVILFCRCSPGCTVPGDLFHILPNGQGLGPHTGLGVSPKWAPDASRIGWLVTQYAGRTIVTTSPSGADPDTVALAEDFAWSPDGTQLAIAYRPSNTDAEIGTVDLAGSRQRVNRTNGQGYDDLYPSWSPDGTRIAFYSARPSAPGIYIMGADGSGQQLLTAATITGPVFWSPDGIHLAFLDSSNFEAPQQLRVVTIQGLEVTLPTELATAAVGFAWSPTGMHALVAAERSSTGSAQVYLARADFKIYYPLALGPAYNVDAVGWLRIP